MAMKDISSRRRTPRILLVEDDETARRMTEKLLADHGYEVASARSAEEAREQIESRLPDVVLLDVVLPGESGFDLCRALKNDPRTRLIPVVLITGLARRQDKLQGIEAGADDFLTKPYYAEELYAIIRSLFRLKEYTDELEHAEAVIESLARGVEARDPYTLGHCDRLAGYAAGFGRHLGLGDDEILALHRGGILHDVGKIAVPDEIFRKPSRLTPEEWQIMKLHPETGENICRPLRSLQLVLPIIRHHHERWDGSGYPDGLCGEAIPLLARVLQVGDIYDALRTERPYKSALAPAEAGHVLREEAASGLLDPQLVPQFFAMLRANSEAA